MLWSSFTSSFYGFLRASECLSLTWLDVTIAEDHVLIELCQSKTDPFRRGQSVHIFSTNSSTCPVWAFKLFSGLVATRPSHLLVFSTETFSPLTHSKLTATIRRFLLQTRWYPHNYSSHSFRISTATTATAVGLPNWLIKTLGRWSSNAYLSYVRCPIYVIVPVPKTLSSTLVMDQPTWNPDKWLLH